LLSKLQPYVVSIKSRSVVSAYGETTISYGSGFIVDVKNGYVFTNAHVANSNKVVVEYLATTATGREVNVKLIYSDPSADIAVFKGDFSSLELKEDLKLSSDNVVVGTNVLIIGKNENRHFSTQTGIVANPNEIEGHLPQHAMRISLNMQGGGSGSLVFDVKSYRVIGIIFASNMATSAFALPISYGIDILKSIKEGKEPKRFGLGSIVEYVSLDDLVKYYGFAAADAEKYTKKYPEAFHRALRISSILPDSPAEGVLEVGDVIVSINGEELGPNLYKLDAAVTKSGMAGENVKIDLVRFGKKMQVDLLPYDMTKRSVKRVVVFGGATFFEADDVVVMRSGLRGKNRVMVTNARVGSPFIEKLPMFPGTNQALVCIEKLGDFSIETLDDLVKAIPDLMKLAKFTVTFRNHALKVGYDEKVIFNQTRQVEEIALFEQDGMADDFKFDRQTHQWSVERIGIA
jgi:S1-C subfamily serine protease